MKTVIDAVNEFKAKKPADMLGRNGWLFAVKDIKQIGYNFDGELVCTFDEFNQCVEEMTNLVIQETNNLVNDLTKEVEQLKATIKDNVIMHVREVNKLLDQIKEITREYH